MYPVSCCKTFTVIKIKTSPKRVKTIIFTSFEIIFLVNSSTMVFEFADLVSVFLISCGLFSDSGFSGVAMIEADELKLF